jgi:hypothetical protein
MAIYYNNRVLEPKENGNNLEKRYFKERKELKVLFDMFRKDAKGGSTLTLERDFPKVWNKNKTSFKPAPPVALPMVTNIYDEELGSIQIRYSKEPPIINSKNQHVYRNGALMFFDVRAITEKEMDFAWFMLKATNYLEKKMVKLVNKKVEFSGKFDELQKQAKANAILFDDNRAEPELVEFAKAVYPDGSTFKYESTRELAVKIWERTKVTEAYGLITSTYEKILNNKREQQGRVVFDVKQENGVEVETEITLVKAPVGKRKAELVAEAEKLGITYTDQTNDLLWSLILQKKNP